MRPLGLLAAWIATLYFASPATAWFGAGHRVVAAIAYERLTPKTRARVDELIRNHPDYGAFVRNAPADPAGRARAAFIGASVWADDIKRDIRFWDDTRMDAVPTLVVAGFPDMRRHLNWHYYDALYTPDQPSDHGADRANFEKVERPNAVTELRRMIHELGSAPQSIAVYDLPWIEHIVGDLHQPLHCVSRVLRSTAKSDAGGSTVTVAGYGNLHAFWDGAAGSDVTDGFVTRYAAEVTAEHPAPKKVEKRSRKWIEESFELATTAVYTFGSRTGSREHPLELPDSYVQNARRVARGQIAMAGDRLAAILNANLR